jgi:hypothetical protein
MREYQFLPSLQFCLKKTGKDTFVKKTLTCETAAAPLCHKAIKKQNAFPLTRPQA